LRGKNNKNGLPSVKKTDIFTGAWGKISVFYCAKKLPEY
jgi:hypothetical protein